MNDAKLILINSRLWLTAESHPKFSPIPGFLSTSLLELSGSFHSTEGLSDRTKAQFVWGSSGGRRGDLPQIHTLYYCYVF